MSQSISFFINDKYQSYVQCCQFDLRSYKNRQNVCLKEYLEDVMGSTKSKQTHVNKRVNKYFKPLWDKISG